MIDVLRLGGVLAGIACLGGFVTEGALSSIAKDAAQAAGRCLAANITDTSCQALESRMISYQYGALGTSLGGVLFVGAAWLTCHIIKRRRIEKVVV